MTKPGVAVHEGDPTPVCTCGIALIPSGRSLDLRHVGVYDGETEQIRYVCKGGQEYIIDFSRGIPSLQVHEVREDHQLFVQKIKEKSEQQKTF
ncbi:MAG: hypothetical protein Q8P25_05220 [Candidatus Curtissbacteria bacterium]|nr:hypothetical protein [Candidatus Curtissbacteria bacterium]